MMKKSRKEGVQHALHRVSRFPLREICGQWESLWGSPSIRIYFDGTRFRLVYEYNPDAAFTLPLRMDSKGNIFFYFYGKMLLTYCEEEDLLTLSNEGIYKRVYD
jgi:hypothetical protein